MTEIALTLPQELVDELVARVVERVRAQQVPRFLDLEATAKHFRTSDRQVRFWRECGAPCVKVGRKLWFEIPELEAWLASR